MEYSLIFGSCGGIGKELAKSLASKGNNLFLSGQALSKLQILKEEISSKYPLIDVKIGVCDLTSSESRLDFFNGLEKDKITLNGLYYVSGIDTQKAFVKYGEEKIVKQARVNYEGALSVTLASLKLKGSTFKILVVSSLTGILPMPYYAEYSSTKSALIYFYTALRYELKGTGVKITILCPGSVPTRSDIVADINKQGLQGKLSKKSASYVVEKGLKWLEKNKRICIPGFYNKVVAFFNLITPLPIKVKIVSKKFKNKEKDYF
jgi:short-subunit dehydrogenase